MFRQSERIRDPAFSGLISVINVLESEILAVPEQSEEIAGIGAPGNQK